MWDEEIIPAVLLDASTAGGPEAPDLALLLAVF
jgi:hypothetical protein